jgi:hypothetical protein
MADDDHEQNLEDLLADLEEKDNEIALLTNENRQLKSKSNNKNKVLLFQLLASGCLLQAGCCSLLQLLTNESRQLKSRSGIGTYFLRILYLYNDTKIYTYKLMVILQSINPTGST